MEWKYQRETRKQLLSTSNMVDSFLSSTFIWSNLVPITLKEYYTHVISTIHTI